MCYLSGSNLNHRAIPLFIKMTGNRNKKTFLLDTIPSLEKITSWCGQFNPCMLLNSNSDYQLHADKYHSFDLLVAAGQINTTDQTENIFGNLKHLHSELKDWLFGYYSYDVKNQVENLRSQNHDGICAPDSFFFQPRYVIEFSGNKMTVLFFESHDPENSINELAESFNLHIHLPTAKTSLNIQSRVNRMEYLENVNAIKKHIRRGDIYEMNYCMEFYAENAVIDPASIYLQLNSLSPMPFSTFMQVDHLSMMSASPERFLAKRGRKIISQPIKGTVKRGADDAEDRMLAEKLRTDPKERSENVMIVDLVRNDLSRTASRGSVMVEELFGIKTFRQLHQMISTVVSEMRDDIHFTEVIKNAFPMGSMTGAPKIRAMELIEEYEKTKRGIYSGSAGYITPAGDFDFNVVIRSILHNNKNRYLSFMAGSAITDGSVAEAEYEECQLKAGAMKNVLGQ